MNCYHLQYFSLLGDFTKKSSEALNSEAQSPEELYAEIEQIYSFSYDKDKFRVAINDEFSDWNTALNDGDRIVFIPPVAGG
ncbi:MoaD/ThiS family protein [Lentisphaera profundi]|uniref:MoaD/ThiS family protein n=1 Tax=Lentisphaera profundi TaxID=1658616 RepID=A0ABY7VPD4_9BACT|nr:MoaD/ThiS family protein [Lentisphaera profundi]WDE95990.1 MoaD/ThiS family protein [Lentisphaera profundi]